MKRLWIIALVCACCLVAVKSGQTQTAQPVGPIHLENSFATQGPNGPVYVLRYLQVSGVKPAEGIWFLQEFSDAPFRGPVEPNETAFRSLDSPVLRDYVAHLPAGASIGYSPLMLPGATPAMQAGWVPSPVLEKFGAFCRSRKVHFFYGISF